jgi:hypothetical protein
LIRPAAVLAITLALASSAKGDQLVTIGGEQWLWGGGATFYRAPGTPRTAPLFQRAQPPPTPVTDANPDSSIQRAARLLRSAAQRLDRSRAGGDPTEAEAAKKLIQQALVLLSQDEVR